MNAKELGAQPAAPTAGFTGPNEYVEWPTYGMTKREAFAMAAMQGFCANPAVFAPNPNNGWSLVNCGEGELSAYCVLLADRHLAELAKEQP